MGGSIDSSSILACTTLLAQHHAQSTTIQFQTWIVLRCLHHRLQAGHHLLAEDTRLFPPFLQNSPQSRSRCKLGPRLPLYHNSRNCLPAGCPPWGLRPDKGPDVSRGDSRLHPDI
ncbi:hypothetical protein GWK47_033404 [Chionoecetes opilio]|uniref:Uncharacterized protein n=1 Tax=Chionoecetes opilio TaxID=41210 RepID=A0A8J5D409_CHIOP|nr:hypothetical protein GWK47_033404 [Chionoecetes opilio]